MIVILFLGHGCLHCVQQLQAFGPKATEFQQAGINLVAISSDSSLDLMKAVADFKEGNFPFPLAANPELSVFKKYNCFDDFEQRPLHGVFLVDGAGEVRWQDISYRPYMEVDFLLKESVRLLEIGAERPEQATTATTPKTPTPPAGG